MKCPECDGVGRIHYGEEWCSACNGTGEVQTNEEWFCGFSTEEKAEWLIEFAIKFIPCELTMPSKKIKTYKNNILEWLKQPHRDKE